MPQVHLIAQDFIDRPLGPEGTVVFVMRVLILEALPPFVFRGARIAEPVEPPRDPLLAEAFAVPPENFPHHLRRLGIDHQVVSVVRVLPVTVRGKRPDKLPFFSFDVEDVTDLEARLPAVVLVHHALKTDGQHV